VRNDFWATTSNKQLNFVQHVKTLLKMHRRAAIGAGQRAIRRWTQVKRSDENDYRTNIHHTLKTNPLQRAALDDFAACFHPVNRHQRKPNWDAEKNQDGRGPCFEFDSVSAATASSPSPLTTRLRAPNA